MKMLATLCAVCALSMSAAFAQTTQVTSQPITDNDIQLLRSDLQSDKNDIITHTMLFTDAESKKFWPIYREYALAQSKIGDQRISLIMDYAKNADTMDDAKASDMAKRLLSIQKQAVTLRETYWPQFSAALGAKRAARFYQVDGRLSLMIDLQLANGIPLVQ